MLGERTQRVFAPVEDQILTQAHLLPVYLCHPEQLLRVDDRHIKTILQIQVEKNRVEDFTTRGRQPEGNIGDPQDGAALREGLLDSSYTFDGFSSGLDVCPVTRTDRENQWVEDQVPLRQTVFAGKKLEAALCDG